MYARDKELTVPSAVAEAGAHYLQVHGGTLSGKLTQRQNIHTDHQAEFTGTLFNCRDQGHGSE